MLTEYVAGPDHAALVNALSTFGLNNTCLSLDVPNRNRVLVAARSRMQEGPIRAAAGWQHALPPDGASYWNPFGHAVRIDHAPVSAHLRVESAS